MVAACSFINEIFADETGGICSLLLERCPTVYSAGRVPLSRFIRIRALAAAGLKLMDFAPRSFFTLSASLWS